MVLIGSILDLIVLAAAGRWLLPHVQRFLEAHGQVEPNYLGQLIPRGMGVVLWLLLWLQELVLQMGVRVESFKLMGSTPLFGALLSLEANNRMYTTAATFIFLLGWTDDLIGSKAVKGLRGHFQYWKETKSFSMGAVKALGTLTIVTWLVISVRNGQTPIWQMGVELVLLMLMTNTLNLLDVRPGRSLKVFFGGTITILLFHLLISGVSTGVLLPILPVCIGGFLLFGLDIGGRGMLGDAGANLLGFTLGYGIIMSIPWEVQFLIIVGLCYLHKLAEVSSITQTIERNRFLNWLDRLGRT
jgi:UDP-GlcNAc:undecaprenyl-phosphate GlcNAc-1-phosphate transferase